jgi:thiol:disulfide interchange protein DsbD
MKQLSLVIFLVSALFAGMPKFLMPDEAFIPHAKLNSSMQIEVNIELAKSMYLYEDKVGFELKNTDGLSVVDVKKPASVEHEEFKVYLESPTFLVSLKNDGASGVKDVEFVLSYQGCSEEGLCYEPLEKSFKFSIDTSKISSKNVEPAKVDDSTNKELSQTDSIAKTIGSGNIFMILLTFLGFGLLLSLTPCVFPMIPIISGLIISQGEGLTTKRAFLLSVVYVLAMAVAYTVAGVLAGLFGANLQAALQNPYVIYSFSGIFVALALSMFGFYEIKLPDSIVSKVSSTNSKGGVVGVAIMGFLSALIVGPCVAAPLAGALVYIGQTGDAVLGGMALFAMSIGMGLPLIAVGVSAGKFMPKPGAWMTMVTATFGIIMLGVAIWMLEKVVLPEITMLLYAVLGLGSAVYFGVFEKDGHVFKKSFAVVLFIYSVSLFLGVLSGSTDMLKPLKVFTSNGFSQTNSGSEKLKFKTVTTFSQLDEILKNNIGKKIILDFSAEWCTACKEYEDITFENEKVKKKMREFVLVRVDVTDNTPEQKEINKKYGVFGPPDIIFIDEKGTFLKSKTIVGYMEPIEFLKYLNNI